MTIATFEYMHGAVLTKLLRNDRPITLRLIETNPEECWSLYRLNLDVNLVIKYATSHRETSKGRIWTFTVSGKQRDYLTSTEQVWMALVCCGAALNDRQSAVCLLAPEEANLLLATPGTPNASVRMAPGKRLRVTINGYVELVVPRSRLETWEIPGS